jgi:hypothetical protein
LQASTDGAAFGFPSIAIFLVIRKVSKNIWLFIFGC